MSDKNKIIDAVVLGGGCFWCLEAIFSKVKGVKSVVSGYAGGDLMPDNKNISYEYVLTGKSGHAEVVRIEFDPSIITLENLLRIFFLMHDPTTLNRQGGDIGNQYRSIILYQNDNQHETAERIMREIAEEKIYGEALIVTELKKLNKFFPAEDYHQNYFNKNPEKVYCQLTIAPKVSELRKKYAEFFVDGEE